MLRDPDDNFFPLRKKGMKGVLIMTAEVQGGIKKGIDPTRIARQFFSYSPLGKGRSSGISL